MLVSNCCSAAITNTDFDICPECLEHCDFEDEEEDEPMCTHCSGTGEGQHDGSRCNVCKGSGQEKKSNPVNDAFKRQLKLIINKIKENEQK